MGKILTVLFFLIGYNSYGQSGKIVLYSTFSSGLSQNFCALLPISRQQDFYYFRGTTSISSWTSHVSLQIHLLERLQFTLKYGLAGMGNAFRYLDHPTPRITGSEREGTIWYMRRAWHNSKGEITTGWWQVYNQIGVTEEYNFYRLRFEKGPFANAGIYFNVGLGLDYSVLLKKYQRDSSWNFHPVYIGTVSVTGMEDQSRNGAGGVLIGLNAQIIYKENKYLKFGVWYHYIPHPNVKYSIRLSSEDKEDDFKLYATKQQLQFFVDIPIKIYSTYSNR